MCSPRRCRGVGSTSLRSNTDLLPRSIWTDQNPALSGLSTRALSAELRSLSSRPNAFGGRPGLWLEPISVCLRAYCTLRAGSRVT